MPIDWGSPDWRKPESLRNISFAQACVVLGQISNALTTRTNDSELIEGGLRTGPSDAAAEFADAARKFHRSYSAKDDCRPALRMAADEKRDERAPGADALDYAQQMRQYHRVK
jgi:hypothetical protein